MPEFNEVSKKRLLTAIINDEVDEINKMVEEGYPVATATFGVGGGTALHLALVSEEDVDVGTIRLLVELGSDLFATSSRGFIPLSTAINNETIDPAVISYLMTQYAGVITAEQLDTITGVALNIEYVYCERDEILLALGRDDLVIVYPEEEDVVDATREYLNQAHIQDTDETIAQIEGAQQGGDHHIYTAEIDPEPNPEMIGAINGLYNKDPLVNTAREDSLYNLIDGMFSNDMPYNIDGFVFKAKSMLDSLGIDLTQLAYLFSITMGSGYLPMYHGGFPGGEPGGGSGGSGVIFENPPLEDNEFVVAYLGNVTVIAAEQHDHSI